MNNTKKNIKLNKRIELKKTPTLKQTTPMKTTPLKRKATLKKITLWKKKTSLKKTTLNTWKSLQVDITNIEIKKKAKGDLSLLNFINRS